VGRASIIRTGFDGLLVPTNDSRALSHAMSELMGDGEARITLSHNARSVRECFALSSVMAKWDRISTGVRRL
jgi:glycosyltransferase involved in cell wall biosynthesis